MTVKSSVISYSKQSKKSSKIKLLILTIKNISEDRYGFVDFINEVRINLGPQREMRIILDGNNEVEQKSKYVEVTRKAI